jgi:hypothetical protein
MADNWAFVFAAYGLAALVLGGYWRRLARRERALKSEGADVTAPSETSPRKDRGGKAAARSGEERV